MLALSTCKLQQPLYNKTRNMFVYIFQIFKACQNCYSIIDTGYYKVNERLFPEKETQTGLEKSNSFLEGLKLDEPPV